jgi:hypothetical protein
MPGVAAAQPENPEQNAPASAGEDSYVLDPAARERLAWDLADRWAPEAAARGYSLDGWRAELVENLLRLDDRRLRQAADAPGYSELVRRVTGKTPLDGLLPTGSPALDAPVPRVLGDDIRNLTYYALTACRIYDSRFATGALAGPLQPGTTITLQTRATMSGQGGEADCRLPSVDAGAIAVNITVVRYRGPGFVTVFPATAVIPTARTVTYGNHAAEWVPSSPNAISIGTILQQCVNCGTQVDISVFTGGSATHVMIDVVGYFDAGTASSTVVSDSTSDVAAGVTWNLLSPTCPFSSVLTGGGMQVDTAEEIQVWQSSPNVSSGTPTQWRCRGRNDDANGDVANIRCYAVCTSLPVN